MKKDSEFHEKKFATMNHERFEYFSKKITVKNVLNLHLDVEPTKYLLQVLRSLEFRVAIQRLHRHYSEIAWSPNPAIARGYNTHPTTVRYLSLARFCFCSRTLCQ